MLLSLCFSNTSLKWSAVAVVQWHQKEAATTISTFLTSAVTDLLTTGIFNFSPPATAFCFLLWSTDHRIILPHNSCFAVSNFFHSQFAEGIYSTSKILFCKVCKLYQSHSNPPLSNLWLNKNTYQEQRSVFSEPSSYLPVSFSAYPKCTLTSMLNKIT